MYFLFHWCLGGSAADTSIADNYTLEEIHR